MKRVDEVIAQTTETNRMLAARQLTTDVTNMTASTTPGQVMARPARAQNMGVSRSAIAFRDENERRKTFEGFWSDTWPVSPKALAQAGFYYCGPEDMVQCAWCYGKLQGWEQGDNPLTEHARHFSSCPKFGDRKAVKASSLVNVHNTQGDAGTSELSEDDLGILTVRPCNPNFAVEASDWSLTGANGPPTWPNLQISFLPPDFFTLATLTMSNASFATAGFATGNPTTNHGLSTPGGSQTVAS